MKTIYSQTRGTMIKHNVLFQILTILILTTVFSGNAVVDLTPYADANGNGYDFGFGLNWKGVIKDARTEKYSVKK